MNFIGCQAPALNTCWIRFRHFWWPLIFLHDLRIGLFNKPITHIRITLYIAWLPSMVNLNVPGVLIGMFQSLFAKMVKFGKQVNICYLLTYLLTYTQYPIIRNSHIRYAGEIWGNFKKRLVKGSNLRNTLK